MKKTSKSGLPCYQFHLIEGFSEDLDHAVFTRNGGVSKAPFNTLNLSFTGDERLAVLENRKRVMKALNLKKCLSGVQTHSKNVLKVDQDKWNEMVGLAGGVEKIEVGDFDGFVTNVKGLGLLIKVADCQSILFYDPGMKILGMAHAGWRGLKQNISAEVIGLMKELGSNPANILVGISPSLGFDNSEFTDPVSELGPEFLPYIKGRKVDLWEFSRQQLMAAGIQTHRIEVARIDTADLDTGSKFFSHRREKPVTGRFGMLAVLK